MAADATLVQGAREAHSYFKGGVDKARNEMFNQLNSNIQNAAAKKQAAAAEEQVKQEKLNKKANSEAEALEKSIDKELIISSMETGIAKAAKSKLSLIHISEPTRPY